MNPAGFLPLCLSALLLPLALTQEGEQRTAVASHLTTLYAHDDLQSSFDFRHDRAGGRVEAGEVRLTDAQIAFGSFARGMLSFGFVRDERVVVLDLGELAVAQQARAADRAEEFPVALFHTLFRDGARFAYVGPGGDVHPFEAAEEILGNLPTPGLRHLEPRVGHTYLLRVRRDGGALDEYFKFEVVDLVADQTLTIRWALVPAR